MQPSRPRGIAGMEGAEPIGCVLSLGIKGPRGNPIDKDRFHVVSPKADSNDIRPAHPLFAAYNRAPVADRKVVTGHLVHATQDEAFSFNLRNQVPKGWKAHPDRRPFCTGNGETAQRWTGRGPDEFDEIVCPHDRCEFRTSNPKQCKPWMRLLFRLSVPGNLGPAMLAKYQSGSWYTTQNVLGLFQHIDTQARAFGLERYSLLGIEFTLALVEQTQPKNRRKFPVVVVSLVTDLPAFFAAQMERTERAMAYHAPAGLPSRNVPALTDQGGEGSADQDDADYLAWAPGRGQGVSQTTEAPIDVEQVGPTADDVRMAARNAMTLGWSLEDVKKLGNGKRAEEITESEREGVIKALAYPSLAEWREAFQAELELGGGE